MRFRLLGKAIAALGQLAEQWDPNWRQAEKGLKDLETGVTGGAVLLAGRSGGQGIVNATAADRRLGLGTGTPAYALDVTGDIRATAAYGGGGSLPGEALGGQVTSFAVTGYCGLDGIRVKGGDGSNTIWQSSGSTVLAITTNGTEIILGAGVSATHVKVDTSGNLHILTAGAGLRVKEGSNARMGVATLVAGTVTVNNSSVTANTRIFLTGQNSSGTHGELTPSARTPGTSFTITSSSATDTRSIAYLLVEPA